MTVEWRAEKRSRNWFFGKLVRNEVTQGVRGERPLVIKYSVRRIFRAARLEDSARQYYIL